jgi:hypothetical protein
MKISHESFRVLGAPVGSDSFMVAFAKARVEEVIDSLQAASFMPELQLQHCLVSGSLIHRINHLLRNIPGGERLLFQDVMVQYDAAVLAVPRRLARLGEMPPLQHKLSSLPAHHGGLGYRTWVLTADAAFLAKDVHVSRHFKSLFPSFAAQFPDVLSLTSVQAARAISPAAASALGALVRIIFTGTVAGETRAALHRDQDKPLRHLQHVLACISEAATHEHVGCY